MGDGIKISGYVRGKVRDSNGSVIRQFEGSNLVVRSGYELFAAILAGKPEDVVSHMAAGDNGITPEIEQTDLQGTELARTATVIQQENHVIVYTADFASISSDITVSEFGLFNDDTAGTMAARFVDTPFPVFAGQSMELEWTIRIGT